MKEVQGKVAFIAGGAAGIGLGMAQAFVRAGMNVVIADIRRDHLDEALAGFGSSRAVHGIQMDVTDREAMADAADEAARVFGKVHVVCNNTGVGVAGPLKLATYDEMYILTHAEFGDGIRARHAALESTIPAGSGNPELRGFLSRIVDNPIYQVVQAAGEKY